MATVGILTISTKGAVGEREDTSGEAIREIVTAAPFSATVAERAIVADDRKAIEEILRRWADELRLDLILTTGGTGLSPTDITPEATLAVLDRQFAGNRRGDAPRDAGEDAVRHAQPRRRRDTRRETSIINLPGSPNGVRECLEVVLPVLPHAIELVSGKRTEHAL